MRRASRLVGLKLNMGVYVIDTEVVMKLCVYLLSALHCNAMLSSRHMYLWVPRNYVACINIE